MVTVERVPHDHLQAAQRRLNNAFDIYRRASNRRYEDAFLEFADVAMLVWSAGVDVASALMRLDDQSDLGTSSRYADGVRWRYEPISPRGSAETTTWRISFVQSSMPYVNVYADGGVCEPAGAI